MKKMDIDKFNLFENSQIIKEYFEKYKINYIEIYSLYLNWLINYLMKKTKLGYYDNKISNSNLNFINIKDNFDVYQYFSSDYLKYFYIRNNIYINRLTAEELKFILLKINSHNVNFDIDAYKFIENTFKKIIYEDIGLAGKNNYVNFGPDSANYFALSNALVIGFRYDEFNSNGLNDDEWFDNRMNQIDFISSLISEMEDEISKDINNPCKIIMYDEYSIDKMNISKFK